MLEMDHIICIILDALTIGENSLQQGGRILNLYHQKSVTAFKIEAKIPFNSF